MATKSKGISAAEFIKQVGIEPKGGKPGPFVNKAKNVLVQTGGKDLVWKDESGKLLFTDKQAAEHYKSHIEDYEKNKKDGSGEKKEDTKKPTKKPRSQTALAMLLDLLSLQDRNSESYKQIKAKILPLVANREGVRSRVGDKTIRQVIGDLHDPDLDQLMPVSSPGRFEPMKVLFEAIMADSEDKICDVVANYGHGENGKAKLNAGFPYRCAVANKKYKALQTLASFDIFRKDAKAFELAEDSEDCLAYAIMKGYRIKK